LKLIEKGQGNKMAKRKKGQGNTMTKRKKDKAMLTVETHNDAPGRTEIPVVIEVI
jgi:hypothetical protein